MLMQNMYPFTAIVGQKQMKKAMLVALTNPKTGGLLIGGQKGTAKTTLVRSCRKLIYPQQIIDLPLNATEDILFGSIDIEAAVNEGVRRFNAGLLSRVDNNIMYIDEVNLLQRRLLTTVFDVMELGTNKIERDGISYEHKAEFTIVATMNPEENTLPATLLDRFGMYVDVESEMDLSNRVAIINREMAFEKNSGRFCKKYAGKTVELAAKISNARHLVKLVHISDTMIQLAAQMCAKAFCRGHRAEFYLLETARTLAALDNRSYILPGDMDEAAVFVLVHRTNTPSQEDNEAQNESNQTDNNVDEEQASERTGQQPPADNENSDGDNKDGQACSDDGNAKDENENTNKSDNDDGNQQPNMNSPTADDKITDIDKNSFVPHMKVEKKIDRFNRHGTGKRTITKTDLKQGRYVRAEIPKNDITDIAIDATIRAAAPYQKVRRKNSKCALKIKEEDIRQKVREKRIGSTFLFIVDASGSMGAYERMRAVKGAIFYMLQEAYQKRDRVGMIAFRRQQAEVLLPITRSVDLAQKCLQELPTGGKTPLADGLAKALQILSVQAKKDMDMEPIVILVTDGRANAVEKNDADPIGMAMHMAEQIQQRHIASVVIDTEADFIKLGIARDIADVMGALYYNLDGLKKENIIKIVQNISNL
ncbi:VWA domain-containing protein [Pectinatus frisingensis]|uniref:VWA domain-containing protein n=1 Tax=Pectinatus frisingensis TaxID=865 RepID=UPI0018C47036|nr:VWA domain-containing protein [Pectinatus frisingensis]